MSKQMKKLFNIFDSLNANEHLKKTNNPINKDYYSEMLSPLNEIEDLLDEVDELEGADDEVFELVNALHNRLFEIFRRR